MVITQQKSGFRRPTSTTGLFGHVNVDIYEQARDRKTESPHGSFVRPFNDFKHPVNNVEFFKITGHAHAY